MLYIIVRETSISGVCIVLCNVGGVNPFDSVTASRHSLNRLHSSNLKKKYLPLT